MAASCPLIRPSSLEGGTAYRTGYAQLAHLPPLPHIDCPPLAPQKLRGFLGSLTWETLHHKHGSLCIRKSQPMPCQELITKANSSDPNSGKQHNLQDPIKWPDWPQASSCLPFWASVSPSYKMEMKIPITKNWQVGVFGRWVLRSVGTQSMPFPLHHPLVTWAPSISGSTLQACFLESSSFL